MNCKAVIRELSNLVDGDLDAAVRQELERHLKHCEDCTLIVDQTKKTIEVLCCCEAVPLPSEVHSRLHAALRWKVEKKPE